MSTAGYNDTIRIDTNGTGAINALCRSDQHERDAFMSATSDVTKTPYYVYFISAGSSPIKIGISNDPARRLNDLQTAHYEQLHLLYTISCNSEDHARNLERAFHRWYGEQCLLNEWFDILPDEISSDIELMYSLSQHVQSIQQYALPEEVGQGYEKQMDARTIIRTHLDSHPEDAALTVRELAAKLNVGKSTVSEVLREVRTQEPAVYSNGNGRH